MKPAAGSLDQGYKWTHKGLEVVGYTLAGITNTLTLPRWSISMDVGQGLPFHMGMKHFFITHAHMDHAHGLPYLIGQKSMMGHPRAQVYFPATEVEKLQKVFRAWEELEDHNYKYDLHPVSAGDQFEISPQYFVRPFPTTHRVPSFGYALFERRKKLKAQYAGLERQELLDLKSRGEELDEVTEHPVFAYTGDTSSKFFKMAPRWVLDCEVLALDVTFWDERKGLKDAHKWGHVHALELPDILDQFQGEKLLVVHISARHRTSFAQGVLDQLLPAEKLNRVEIFPRP